MPLIDEPGIYKTRDGRKVVINDVNATTDINHTCGGITPDGDYHCWCGSGKYNVWLSEDEDIDIVEKLAKTETPPSSPSASQLIPQETLEREAIKIVFCTAVDQLPDACLPFARILSEAVELHSKKSRDYGSDQDPYANVRASEEFGIPGWVGCVVRSHDKIVRLKQFCKKGSLANESAEDSLLDLCVYFPIALMLYRQASQGAANQPVVD